MRIARSSRSPLVEAPMVSLADIAFLMIFFFLASSNFMKDPLSIMLPDAEKQAQTSAVTTVVVGVNPQKDLVEVYLDGDRIGSFMKLADARKKFNGVDPEGQKLADQLEAKLKDVFARFSEEGREVQFKCDRAMSYGDYSPVLTAIGNAGGAIAIIHEER